MLGGALLIAVTLPCVVPGAAAQRARPGDDAARTAQRAFEAERRDALPQVAGHRGSCDVAIGRLCYWADDDDSLHATERPAVRLARARLRALLDSLGTSDPGSAYLAGQRVRYALDAGDTAGAVALADRCAATPWWCNALRGLAQHRAGNEAASAAAFDSALAAMPDTLRCDWLDVHDWLPPGTHPTDARGSLCVRREREAARLLWLAAPLMSWRPRATRDELLSRRTMIAILTGTATPHAMRWGSDMAEMTLRYGWPSRWAREAGAVVPRDAPDLHVFGDDPLPSFAVVPDHHALNAPFAALPNDWRLAGQRDSPMRYAPGWLRSIDTLPVQIARFRRAGGDSMAVVAVYDAWLPLRGDTDRLRAAMVLARAPDTSLTLVQDGAARAEFFLLVGPAEPVLAAVEVVDSAQARAVRWRAGLAPLKRSALVSDLLVGLAGPERLPTTLDSAAGRSIASLRVSVNDTLALYWESYARPASGRPARVALRLTALDRGGLGRVVRWLGFSHGRRPVSLAWDDPGAADGAVGRSLRLAIPDVPPGRYRLELVVTADGAHDTAARDITIVAR